MDNFLKKHKQQFTEKFHPRDYANIIQDVLVDNFFLYELQRVFASGKYNGDRCLDFGCGPTVHCLASASQHYRNLVSSDFMESNRNEVEKWCNKESDAIDWSETLKNIAKLEGFDDVQAGSEIIAERIRCRLKSVVHCDVLAERALPDSVPGDFDMIISCLCLESAAPNYDFYKLAVKRLADLLKPQGTLLLMGVLEETYWHIMDRRFSSIYLTRSMVEDALTGAGFADIHWTQKAFGHCCDDSDCKGQFFVACVKT